MTLLLPPFDAPDVVVPAGDRLRLGRYPVVLPKVRDPRIHLSIVTITIFVIGINWLGFRLSIVQILAAAITSAAIELAITVRRTSMIIWPASALQTASSTALLLRVEGTASHDLWSWHGWYYFAGIAAFGVVTKHTIRTTRGHVFNPSNIAITLAFLAFGSHRIEPLDFWWGPLRAPMIVAYAVIVAGGLFIGRRLRLIAMGVAFWATLAAGIGVLAALDHSITARWSLDPIRGGHFWWIVLTSPEILIFLFFMLTDPRTVPSGRVARVVFGSSVAALGSLMMAPWQTEFGVKVGLLAALAIACAVRPLLEARLPAAGSPEDSLRVWLPAALRRRLMAPLLAAGTIAWCVAVGVAGIPAVAGADPPAPIDTLSPVDPASLPRVTVDPDVAGLSARVASPAGAQELAATLAFNLDVEREAVRTRDPSLLIAVDHGDRLDAMQRAIAAVRPGDDIVASTYEFHSLQLIVVFPGGAQRGANAGMVATATETDITYAPDGREVSRAEKPVELTFAMRRTTSNHWQITTTLPPPD